MNIDISEYSKEEVLATLYNNSKPLGMGILAFNPKDMTKDEAKSLIKDHTIDERIYFDYLKGRVMKIDLSSDQLNPRLYDRDNGEGAAQRAISNIKK